MPHSGGELPNGLNIKGRMQDRAVRRRNSIKRKVKGLLQITPANVFTTYGCRPCRWVFLRESK